MAWVSFSPSQDFRTTIEPHSGHLIFLTLWLYHGILETIGTDYLTFRLLTLAMVYLSVILLFIFARKRVGEFVALAPCLVLLFFGSDAGNLMQGIGFTIMVAVALGMIALLAVERNTLTGDLLACAALSLGVVSFTLALPFLAGAIVAVLLTRERWRRIWVVAIPLAIYLTWRIWLVVENVEIANGGADPTYLLLAPSWIFQSLSGILSALTGFNYNFATGNFLPPDEMAGPPLALAFLVLIGWRINKGRLDTWFLVVMTVALSLFISQAVGWIPEVRTPGVARYLFPGAFVVILVLAEAFRGSKIGRTAFITIWLFALCGLLTNIAFIGDAGRSLRERAPVVAAEVTASSLVTSAYPYYPGESAEALVDLVTDPGVSVTRTAEQKWGGLGFTEEQLLEQPAGLRANADHVLSRAFGLGLVPSTTGLPGGCRTARAEPGENSLSIDQLPSGGVVLRSGTAGQVRLRRFDSSFSTGTGLLIPGRVMTLYIPEDGGQTPWQLEAYVKKLTVCEFKV